MLVDAFYDNEIRPMVGGGVLSLADLRKTYGHVQFTIVYVTTPLPGHDEPFFRGKCRYDGFSQFQQPAGRYHIEKQAPYVYVQWVCPFLISYMLIDIHWHLFMPAR